MKKIASLFYIAREWVWNYPDIVFLGEYSLFQTLVGVYKSFRPYSHLGLSIAVYLIIFSFILNFPATVLSVETQNYVEGTITGVDENGEVLGITKVNPLVPSTIQLEEDISGLIYESLFVIDQENQVRKQLIESFSEIKKANHYGFKLRNDVYWHDGRQLTTADVKATTDLLKRLNESPDTASRFSVVVADQLADIEIIDDFEFELKLQDEESVLPTLLESLTFKILPAPYIENLTNTNILSSTPEINRNPIGTGPFQNLEQVRGNGGLRLSRNREYYRGSPSLSTITFVLFIDEDSAFKALETGKIHAVQGISSEFVQQSQNLSNYKTELSNVVYNQYLGLHFNLNQLTGDEIFKDLKMRRAIGYAIDRQKIILELEGLGEPADGTIPKISTAYNDNIDRVLYNPQKAGELLDELDWKINARTGERQNKNDVLTIRIFYVDNIDRTIVAESIKNDLEALGIKVELIASTIDTVNENYILTKSFDLLLYWVETFIDPDRYELYHSSQADTPDQNPESTGLNITSYSSDEKTRKIDVEQELIDVPKVDTLLENIRSVVNEENRKEDLEELQKILNNEMPTIYLYHPIYAYIVNRRVENLNLSDMNNVEDRFNNIHNWNLIE